MARTPTIRSLARRLRLSVATVSEALRDSPRVHPQTRARVQRMARRTGYRVNPLLGAALSAVRRQRQQHYRGTIALIDTDEEKGRLFHREIIPGAEARARELGFRTELFWLGEREPALPIRRLPGVLLARGIAGAVMLPFHTAQDLGAFDFSRLSAVQMDHCLLRPQLHTILPDHYLSMIHALERLTQRGYTRVGLCMAEWKDARIKSKWTAAFQAFFRGHARDSGIPPLIETQVTKPAFLSWYRHYRPDVIVGHLQEIVGWLAGIGVDVPEDAGFFNLNVTERTGPCAGLDLGPRRLGAAAIETVVAMLHRQERGVPAFPQTITLEAMWLDGPTLRPVAATTSASA